MSTESFKSWDPSRYLDGSSDDVPPFAVIVLNLPIQNYRLFSNVINKAKAVIAADGGANRMKHYYERKLDIRQSPRLPDAIVGDLDSLSQEAREYFERKGVPIVREADQYSPDFSKCLRYLSNNRSNLTSESSPALDTVVFGGLGGRADQAFSQLSHLYVASQDDTLQCGDIYLFSEESIMFLLEQGDNKIRTPVGPEQLGENIGIIPIAAPAVITTTGFEWDVKDWETSFGSQMSTSNHIRSDHVTVKSNQRVLFTVELDRKPTANGK